MNPELFNQIFGTISANANSGAQATGTVANYLIGLGLGAAAITQILNGVATSAQASPEMIDYVQREMMYAQNQYTQPQSNGALWLIGGLAVLLLLNRE